MKPKEAVLISRILARDRKALLSFYRIYKKKLERYITRKVKNSQDAEEILQDSLFAFLDKARDFEGKSSISTYLHAICQRKIVDYYRRKKIRQTVFSQMPQLESLVANATTPEEELDSRILEEKIARTLRQVLPKYKNILISKYEENKSVAEIANKLCVSVKSAESILFRARRAFVKAFVGA